MLDEFARDEDKTRKAEFKAALQELGDLEREGVRILYVLDAGLGRVGEDEAEVLKSIL